MMKEVLMKADSECLSQFKLLLIRVKKELSQVIIFNSKSIWVGR